jgi:hypothetical protein
MPRNDEFLKKALLEGGHGIVSSWKRYSLKEAREPWVPEQGTP